jgi:hypothetical protein
LPKTASYNRLRADENVGDKARGRMRVRCFWRDYRRNRGKTRGSSHHIDAFWIEATEEEARTTVFPFLNSGQITESNQLAEQWYGIAVKMGDPVCPFCFLIARDLTSVEPFHPHYPIHNLWNGYSPFESMPEISIATLDAILEIALPPVLSDKDKYASGPDLICE